MQKKPANKLMEKFVVIQRFQTEQEANAALNLLRSNNIKARITFDKSGRIGQQGHVRLMVYEIDHDKAKKLLENVMEV